ncbi:MAG: MBOAT family protein [Cyanobacteria bacterium SZAS TMP-1]|nr:MBOAT family protein [Cyanobacteria bacterium SZAS TMP-1]
MLFSSLPYLLFLPIACLAFWLLPHRFRSTLLLVGSFYFYMSWIPIYGVLLFTLTVANYFLGRAIYANLQKGDSRARAKAVLVAGIVLNLATLSYFKYTDFAISSWNSVVAGVAPFLAFNPGALSFPLQHVLLPLGISFFVFEFIHYITDIYKGSKPINNFVNFSLFAAFFPSQIAGPIKRYQDFIKQLEVPRVFSSVKFEQGIALLLQGLFKKVALADNLSPIVTQGFAHATALGGAEAWIASLAFAIQIYCDFSGYTDMGRGSALLMGFDLPDNFNWPYLAKSLTDFWKRWHISLSSWLRDYLYIPLGGSKCSTSRRHFNLLTTMLLGGLWHGASWHFVVWGAIHGLGLIVNHSYDALINRDGSLAGQLKAFHKSQVGTVISMLGTFAFVLVGWVFFRAETMADALAVLHGMCSPAVSSTVLVETIEKHPVFAALGVYAVYRIIADNAAAIGSAIPTAVARLLKPMLPARVVIYVAIFIMAVGLAPATASPFIYFAF